MRIVPRRLLATLALLSAFLRADVSSAQDVAGGSEIRAGEQTDSRDQYPKFLLNSYLSLRVGFIEYPFSAGQLEAGSTAAGVQIPHAALGLVLFGHQFHKYFSAQMAYMRPMKYVAYQDVNQSGESHTVWLAFGQFTVKTQVPVMDRMSIYGEAGVALTNRLGFTQNDQVVVPDAHFASFVTGGGVQYHLNSAWDLVSGFTYSPANAAHHEPRTVFASGGLQYTVRERPEQRTDQTPAPDVPAFPKHMIQAGYSTNALGYGVNEFFTSDTHLFFAGHVDVAHGLAAQYARNIFHTPRLFAVEVGVRASRWRSVENGDRFVTVSAFPLLRFTPLRVRRTTVYASYSVAGPSYISRKLIDGQETGMRFTFQDSMGVGAFVGARRRIAVGIEIAHYSNGNLFGRNPGVTVPLQFNLGYAF